MRILHEHVFKLFYKHVQFSAFCIAKRCFQVFISSVFDLSDLQQSQKHRNKKVTTYMQSLLLLQGISHVARMSKLD